MTNVRRATTVAAAVLTGMAVIVPAVPAQTAQGPVASGSVGSVRVTLDGAPTSLEPLASCVLGTTPQAAIQTVSLADVVSYGPATATCATEESGNVNVKVEGQHFETSVLTRYGGPAIAIGKYTLECRTTGFGTSASMAIGGVTGFDVPIPVRRDFEVTIPSATAGDPPLAKLTLNELDATASSRAGRTAHAMRMTLFPEGGPASGEIVLGTTSCDPASAPAPMPAPAPTTEPAPAPAPTTEPAPAPAPTTEPAPATPTSTEPAPAP